MHMKTLVASLVIFLGTIFGTVPMVHAAVSIGLSPNNFTMTVGQQRTVNATGATAYYLGSNSNPAVASASLSGSFITLNALSAGTDSVSICAYDANNLVSCAAVNVTVQKDTTAPATSQAATISFSQNQINVNVGSTQSVTVTGSANGSYYVSTISDPTIVSASVAAGSNIVTISGSAVGGSNVTVCQFGGTCGNVYAYVPPTSTNIQAVYTNAKIDPGLSAFYIASNGASFLSSGSTLTIKFNTNHDITSEVLRIGTQSLQVNGTSSGPYSATYTLNGSEPYPLPVSIDFWAADGTAGHTSFTVNDSGMPQAAASASVAGSAGSAAGSAGARFTHALSSGSTGAEVSALQIVLKRLGFFNGPVTGNYGPLTAAAVKKYQGAHGLDQLGSVGPGTRAALNKE